jgi:hypothetical protein
MRVAGTLAKTNLRNRRRIFKAGALTVQDRENPTQARRNTGMNSKSIALTLTAIATIAVAIPAEARINQRQDRQQSRIANGINNGNLTAREAAALEQQQASIACYEARSRADGPGLTTIERARIENRQDKASHSIRRQRHD